MYYKLKLTKNLLIYNTVKLWTEGPFKKNETRRAFGFLAENYFHNKHILSKTIYCLTKKHFNMYKPPSSSQIVERLDFYELVTEAPQETHLELPPGPEPQERGPP